MNRKTTGLSLILLLVSSVTLFAGDVLFVGGTYSVGPFGPAFDKTLRSRGLDVTSVADGFAGPYHWLDSYLPLPGRGGYWEKSGITEQRISSVRNVPKLEALMESVRPEVVVVQLGCDLYASLRCPRPYR